MHSLQSLFSLEEKLKFWMYLYLIIQFEMAIFLIGFVPHLMTVKIFVILTYALLIEKGSNFQQFRTFLILILKYNKTKKLKDLAIVKLAKPISLKPKSNLKSMKKKPQELMKKLIQI